MLHANFCSWVTVLILDLVGLVGDSSIYVLYNREHRLPVDVKYLPPVTDDVTASVFEHRKRVVESSS